VPHPGPPLYFFITLTPAHTMAVLTLLIVCLSY
jgi:hypothetical protein